MTDTHARTPASTVHFLVFLMATVLVASCSPSEKAGKATPQTPVAAPLRPMSADEQAARLRAERGDAEMQQSLGYAYLVGEGVPQDYREALKWLRRAADRGSAAAEYHLALMYGDGLGVPRSPVERAAWLRKASEQEYLEAQEELGLMYVLGQGVPVDLGEGVKWLRLAADQGAPTAQGTLGVAYSDGKGVEQDVVEACKWYTLGSTRAAGETQKRFAKALDGLLATMTVPQIAEAQKRTSDWLEAYERRKDK